jgi:hypothetical protein
MRPFRSWRSSGYPEGNSRLFGTETAYQPVSKWQLLVTVRKIVSRLGGTMDRHNSPWNEALIPGRPRSAISAGNDTLCRPVATSEFRTLNPKQCTAASVVRKAGSQQLSILLAPRRWTNCAYVPLGHLGRKTARHDPSVRTDFPVSH